MKKKKTILALVSKKFENSPDHLKYGAEHMQEVSYSIGKPCKVKIRYFKDQNGILQFLNILWLVISNRHDILYYTTDPSPLILVALLKKIKLYNKPMYAWKYVALSPKKNKLSCLLQKCLYDAFNMIFMMTESHVRESVDNGIITSSRCMYMKWGEDVDYIDSLPCLPNNDVFTFISTGKAFRDFDTLCKAFNVIKGARLKIFTNKTWGNINYKEVLDKYKNPNIEIIYSNQIVKGQYNSVLDYLFAQMKASDCAVIICKDVDFGVGYTAVLDSMACGLPVIATWNKDNPLDIDKEGIGDTVPVYDVKSLQKMMQKYVDNNIAQSKGERGKQMILDIYNIRRVANDVLRIMIE